MKQANDNLGRATAPPIEGVESPPVATAEARTLTPLRVSSIEVIARSRLLTVSADALLAAANQEGALLRNDVMGAGYP